LPEQGVILELPDLNYLATLAGVVGGVLSVGAFLPQAWRILRRRSAADVSLAMYLSIVVSTWLWMFYAYVHGSVELFLTNLVIGAIAMVIAGLRLRYGRG
jgi:MtN3 and saliva related transmembrane protein